MREEIEKRIEELRESILNDRLTKEIEDEKKEHLEYLYKLREAMGY